VRAWMGPRAFSSKYRRTTVFGLAAHELDQARESRTPATPFVTHGSRFPGWPPRREAERVPGRGPHLSLATGKCAMRGRIRFGGFRALGRAGCCHTKS